MPLGSCSVLHWQVLRPARSRLLQSFLSLASPHLSSPGHPGWVLTGPHASFFLKLRGHFEPFEQHCGFGRLPMEDFQPGPLTVDIFLWLVFPPPSWCHAEVNQDHACFPGFRGRGLAFLEVFQQKSSSPTASSSTLLQERAGCLALGFNSFFTVFFLHPSSPASATGEGGM